MEKETTLAPGTATPLEQTTDPLASLAEVPEEDTKTIKVQKVITNISDVVPQKRAKAIKRLMEVRQTFVEKCNKSCKLNFPTNF